MKKYLVEFIGAFFLVLTIVCTVNAGVIMAPLVIGTILMVMVYAGGHISGAHYNPAVTLSILIRGKIAGSDVAGYIIAQILGGITAALIGTKVLGMTPSAAATGMDMVPGIVAEILGTFALCYVVLNTATANSTAGNSYYGLAIGFTIMAVAWGLGSWTGGIFNPAVGIGVLTAGMTTGANLAAIIGANIVGAIIAAWVFKITYEKQGDDD